MPTIKNKATLEKMLQRMYWVENEMEQLNTWEARLELMNDNIEALEILSHESDMHASIVHKWILKANIDVPEQAPQGIPRKMLDFEGMSGPEIFSNIVKYEVLMLNAYTDIKKTDPHVLNELFPEQTDVDDFLKDMDRLIKDEKRHAEICKKQAGGFAKVAY